MSIYAIGDIQGCYNELSRLLDKIQFNPKKDQLWFTGDLVNRGPNSLETLRLVKDLGTSAVTVLGNHDLHLLAAACKQRTLHKKDSLQQVLEAPDRDELLHWLRHRPLFHHNDHYCLLHAGLPPQWSFKQTRKMAAKVEKVLRSSNYQAFFKHMYGNKPSQWSEQLTGDEQLRFIVNCFTRMRYCTADGELEFEFNGRPGTQAKHLFPWYALPGRKSADMRIIFGHWSTLGYHDGDHCYGIDTGCLWGGQLTALKLGKKVQRIAINCKAYQKPG